MTESPDPQLQLKKRARRRLVGAVAFAGLAAVVLPMVMDEEPKQQAQEVQIRIPGQEQPTFKPKDPVAKPLPKAEIAAASGTPVEEAPTVIAPVPTNKAVPAVTANTKAAPLKPTDKAPEKKVVKPAEKAIAVEPERKTVKSVDKVAEAKPPLKKVDKTVEKAPEKPSTRKAERTAGEAERTAVKPVEKPVEQTTSDRGPEKALEKAAEKPAEEAAKTTADESTRAAAASAAPAASKPSTAAPPTPKSGTTQHVILIGAFANADNVKQLQSKIGSLGVNTYTELLTLPDGTKTRVRAGPFPTREAAEKALEKLKRSGVNGVVASRQ